MADQENNQNAEASSAPEVPAKEDPPKTEDSNKESEEKKDDADDANKDDASTQDESPPTDGQSGGDDGLGGDQSGSDPADPASDDSSGSGSDFGADEPGEEEVSVEAEAQKLVAAEEAEQALGVSVSLEAIADFMDRHPQPTKAQQYLLYLNVRSAVAGTGHRANQVFPCLESYEESADFKLTPKIIRDRVNLIKQVYQ